MITCNILTLAYESILIAPISEQSLQKATGRRSQLI
jgi:hypothetical protein